MTRRLPHILLAALLLFAAGRCLVPMDETDLFFNVRQGDIVMETGKVPTTNNLSYTYPEHRDVNLAWVFQVVLALAFKAGGITGCVILKTLFALGTLTLLYRVALARGAHPAVAAGALALTCWAMEHRLSERPHLVTFVGLAVVLLAIERMERGRPKMLWSVVAGAVVWANANSCFFEAPALLLLYAAGSTFDAFLAPVDAVKRSERFALARRAAIVGLALVPFILMTPSGVHALGYIANHWRMPYLRPLQEYFPIEWPDHAPAIFLGAALVIGTLLGRPRTPFRVLLPIAALFALGSARRRFLAEFALVAGPAVAASWTAMLGRLRSLRIDPALASAVGGGSVVVGLVVLTVLPRVQDYRAKRPVFDLGMEQSIMSPVGTVDFMNKVGLRDRMYNDMELGSYLTWEGAGKYKVFQDPRINAYPDEFHAIMKRKDLTREEFGKLLDKFGVKTALVSEPAVNPRAALFDNKDWATVQRTNWALCFVRRLPEFKRAIRRFELPLTFSWTGEETMVVPVEQQLPDSPIKRCEWARRLGEFYLAQTDIKKAWQAYREAVPEGNEECIDQDARQATKIAMAGLALQMSNPAAAAEMYKGMLDPESKSNRGFALATMRKWTEALEEFDGALRMAPATSEAMYGRGVALMELKRRDEAIAALKAFLKHAPDHKAAQDAKSRLQALGAQP